MCCVPKEINTFICSLSTCCLPGARLGEDGVNIDGSCPNTRPTHRPIMGKTSVGNFSKSNSEPSFRDMS